MKNLRQIAYKVLFVPVGVIIPLTVVSAAALIYAFVFEEAQPIVVYGSYALSAYALMAICVRVPALIRSFRSFKEANSFARRYVSEPQYRVKLSLYASLTVNTMYALLQLGLGLYHHSIWFYALAAYYWLLVAMRFFLLKETRSKTLGQDKLIEFMHYRLCGVLLLAMNIALMVIVFYIVQQNRGFEHDEILTISMAAYTFFSFAIALVNIRKYRRHGSPVMSAAKIISFAAALVSILSLETSMLSAFGETNEAAFRRLMTAGTGTEVLLAVLIMAVYMIVHSTVEMKKLSEGQADFKGDC